MSKKSEYFRGWPRTVRTQDGYRIEAWHRTPFLVKTFTGIGIFGGTLLALVSFGYMINFAEQAGYTDGSVAVPFFLSMGILYACAQGLPWLARIKTTITIAPGVAEFKRGLFPKRALDFTRIENIVCEEHIKSPVEAREQELKLRENKKVWPWERYYQESMQIIAYESGRRTVLVNIFGKEDAMRLYTRLMGLLSLVNNRREWAAWEHDKPRKQTRPRRRLSGDEADAYDRFERVYQIGFLVLLAALAGTVYSFGSSADPWWLKLLLPWFIAASLLILPTRFITKDFDELPEILWEWWKAFRGLTFRFSSHEEEQAWREAQRQSAPAAPGRAGPRYEEVEQARTLFGLPHDFSCAMLRQRLDHLLESRDPGEGFILKAAHEVLKKHRGC